MPSELGSWRRGLASNLAKRVGKQLGEEDWRGGGGTGKRKEEGREEGRPALIKSKDPHLAGGESTIIFQQTKNYITISLLNLDLGFRDPNRWKPMSREPCAPNSNLFLPRPRTHASRHRSQQINSVDIYRYKQIVIKSSSNIRFIRPMSLDLQFGPRAHWSPKKASGPEF